MVANNFSGTAFGVKRSENLQSILEHNQQTASEKGHQNMRFDTMAQLMIQRTDARKLPGCFFPLRNCTGEALLALRFCEREEFAKEGEDLGDAEGLLEEEGIAAGGRILTGVPQVAGHVDDGGFLQA